MNSTEFLLSFMSILKTENKRIFQADTDCVNDEFTISLSVGLTENYFG